MKELYYIKPFSSILRTLRLEFGKVKNKFILRIIEGEIKRDTGKSDFNPIEDVFDEEQEMLKKVWEMRKQLSEEKWNLKTQEKLLKIKQHSIITLKTKDGDMSLEFDN